MFTGFTEVTVKNQDGTDAIDVVTGLKCKRRCIGFYPNGDTAKLQVDYWQWLVGLNGEIKDLTKKNYYVYDSLDIYYSSREVKTPATFYEAGETMTDGTIALGGEIKTPTIMHDGTEIKVPAKNNFTTWANYVITEQMVGLTLTQLFIDAQINPRLTLLPIDVKNSYDNT